MHARAVMVRRILGVALIQCAVDANDPAAILIAGGSPSRLPWFEDLLHDPEWADLPCTYSVLYLLEMS
jgi:hypothetical protein